MIKLVFVFAGLFHVPRWPLAAGAAFTAGSLASACGVKRSHSSRCFADRLPNFVVAARADDSEDESGDTTSNTDGLGLLRGVDPTVDYFYANEIDMSKEGLAWLDKPGLMWEAAKKDAKMKNVTVEEYIMGVKAGVQAFKDTGIIYDREELLGDLDEAITDNGCFALLLGGKNVGKSTVLKFLAKQNARSRESTNLNLALPRYRRFWTALASILRLRDSRRVEQDVEEGKKFLILYVDAKLAPGRLDVGLANGIAQLAAETLMRSPEKKEMFQVMKEIVRVGGVFAVTTFLSSISAINDMKKDVQEVVDLIAKSVSSKPKEIAEVSKNLLDIFIKMAREKNAFPVLVIDEANIVLGIEKDGEKQDFKTGNVLTNIACYTKQDGSMNVIMASSEYSYPYRLKREGFNLANVQRLIFAGEIPPKAMWKLLVSATYEEGDNKGKLIIGMGSNLAELCLAVYGGHFLYVKLAIQYLSRGQDRFKASAFLPILTSEIVKCLDNNNASRPLLEDMAKYGFAPIETPDNPAAELISKENIGGVVNDKAKCIGISETKWDGTPCHDALIPSSHCVRLEIARALITRQLLSESNST